MANALPIDAILPDVLATLRSTNATILRAPTGAGKTTRVPPALLDGLPGSGMILMLEPRRLAARSAAQRMASERGQRLGDEIGYHVRFERNASRRTRVLVITPGILLRRLLDDPYLDGVDAVLFDEFHERGLDTDLILGLTRLIQQTVRPELRLMLMSATIDPESLRGYLGECPVHISEGRLHPVEIRYCPTATVVEAVLDLLNRTPGDLLVFLPGMGEIRTTQDALESQTTGMLLLPLHGDLPLEQQSAALTRQARRRIVLATNVAETSVTVEGVTGVVDTGLARQLNFDPDVGLDSLRLSPISRASADQRAGRAGRTAPGMCVRLWSEANHRGRGAQTEPEIRRLDLAGAVLHLLALGENPREFPWPEPPPEAAVERALALLDQLGAQREARLTDLGQAMARVPVHPRLGRMLLEGSRLGCLERTALVAALLSERSGRSDLLDRIEGGSIHPLTRRARDQLLRLVVPEAAPADDPEEASLRAMLAAYPDRVVRRREGEPRRGRMVGGRGVRLHSDCRTGQGELFLAVGVSDAPTEAVVWLAASLRREWLDPEWMRAETVVVFDPETEQVHARKRRMYADLTLEESPAALPDPALVAAELERAARLRLSDIVPTEDSPAGQFRTRLRCLAGWLPELSLPSVEANALAEWLSELCRGQRSFAGLRANWLPILQGRLSYEQSQAIEREAPERLEVPSGSRIALTYEVGRPPILAVRIQEVFGLAQTPRIARNRVPVLLHLLAPNYRPQQVTTDLASFWTNTYPLIRKELRARYPRHSWPDDPLAAEAIRGPRRK